MPNTNASFSPATRTERFQRGLDKLERLMSRRPLDSAALAAFDAEVEELLAQTYGPADSRVQAYKYAVVAEAASVVNMPESAQEAPQDVPMKALQQRRQVLEGCFAELQEAEAQEAQALTGEDHEDPPMKS
ncbi:hypothetical protein [Candidatus Nitrospira bockiana]